MKDSMSQYTGIAAAYSQLPLIALRELESVLQTEIRERLEAFGERVSESGVGDVEKPKTVFSAENNVILVDFKGIKQL